MAKKQNFVSEDIRAIEVELDALREQMRTLVSRRRALEFEEKQNKNNQKNADDAIALEMAKQENVALRRAIALVAGPKVLDACVEASRHILKASINELKTRNKP